MRITPCSPRPILVPCGLDAFDYQIDPYIGCGHLCHYCYVLNQAETDWESAIYRYDDIAGQLRDEIEGIAPQTIYMGYFTDPYQPCEADCFQTRKILEVLLDKGFSASILTKSDLVLRDLDLLRGMEAASVGVSVAFSDNGIRRQFEAHTGNTEARIAALHQIKAVGIRTTALICPVVPYLTDVMGLLKLLAPCTEVIWIYPLSILSRSNINWRHVESILEDRFPQLKTSIEEVLFENDHPYWRQIRHELAALEEDDALDLRIHL